MTANRSLLRRCAGWIAALFLAALVLECGSRVYVLFVASQARFQRYATLEQVRASGRLPVLVQRHPYLVYSLRPNSSRGDKHIDALGYRGGSGVQAKPAGEFRIVCVGGSTTFGGGIERDQDTYPAQLERELIARGCAAVRVINAGVSGYTSFETLANVQFRVLDLEPDLIVVYHAVNDLMTRLAWPPEAYRGDNSAYRAPTDQVFMPSLLEYSTLLRILLIELGLATPHTELERLFGGRAESHVGLPDPASGDPTVAAMLSANSPRFYTRNLGNLAAVARRNRAQVVFMSFAHCTQLERQTPQDRELFALGLPQMNAALEELARSEAVPWFDLAAQFPDDAALYSDPVHMNPQGARVQADLLAEFLLDNQLVPRGL